MESIRGRVSLTTWVVLALCVLAGVVAVAMTAVVIVRLNRQVLASAAELRASLSASGTPSDPARDELLEYAAQMTGVEGQWAATIADYRLRYPGNPLYDSVATAQALTAVRQIRRPASLAELHDRWSQAWSDRDAALALQAVPNLSDEDRLKAADLGRKASDDLRRVKNELRDRLLAAGATESDIAPLMLSS